MARKLMHYACCLIVLTSCVDQGDGRWKKKGKGNLQHDIDIFKKMAEKIEHEIELFYEDYSDELTKQDNVEKTKGKYLSTLTRDAEIKHDVQRDRKEESNNFTHTYRDNLSNDIQTGTKAQHLSESNVPVSFRNNTDDNTVNKSKHYNSNWPKFEDILLAIGKKYDWKNDRWIKVKGKLKEPRKKVEDVDNSINFREKHKFSYKFVKLSRSKSRRNIVMAVTAVR